MMNLVRSYPYVWVLPVLTLVFGLMSPTFFEAGNLANILKQSSLLGFVALGMCFCSYRRRA